MSYYIRFLYFIGVGLFCNAYGYHATALTYQLSGGRFGDNVAGTFTKALFLAWKYHIPFEYEAFPGSDQLCMHTLFEQHQLHEDDFARVIKLDNEEQLKNGIQENTLYVVHFYTMVENVFNKALYLEPEFSQLLKQAIAPCFYNEAIEIPAGHISVAVHVRKGSGPDKPLASLQLYDNSEQPTGTEKPAYLTKPLTAYADYVWPTKFPPDQYYIDQIIKLSELVHNAPLYVYIFTDAADPQALAQLYKSQIKKDNIIFGFRNGHNQYASHIVHDYYHMAQFNCLIRSSSLFAKAAQLLGNHQIVIYPVHGTWAYDRVIIDKVGVWERSKKKGRLYKKSPLVI